MSNYMTNTVTTVFGDKRIVIGTMVVDDGDPAMGGLAVQLGLANVDFCIGHGKDSTADCAQMTYVSGGAVPLSAASGLSFKVFAMGY